MPIAAISELDSLIDERPAVIAMPAGMSNTEVEKRLLTAERHIAVLEKRIAVLENRAPEAYTLPKVEYRADAIRETMANDADYAQRVNFMIMQEIPSVILAYKDHLQGHVDLGLAVRLGNMYRRFCADKRLGMTPDEVQHHLTAPDTISDTIAAHQRELNNTNDWTA